MIKIRQNIHPLRSGKYCGEYLNKEEQEVRWYRFYSMQKNIVMHHITTFQPRTDRIYDGGPIRL